MKNLDLIQEAIKAIATENSENAIKALEQFVRLNTPKIKGDKVNIWNWIDPKEFRGYCQGVYYDVTCGVAVATDTHVLLVSKPDAELDGKNRLIGKDGKEIVCSYPDYNRVFRKEQREIDVNVDKVVELLNQERVDKKLGKEYYAFNVSDSHNFYLTPKICKLLITMPREGKFYVSNSDNWRDLPLQYESNDGNYRALFMPIMVKDEHIGMDAILKA